MIASIWKRGNRDGSIVSRNLPSAFLKYCGGVCSPPVLRDVDRLIGTLGIFAQVALPVPHHILSAPSGVCRQVSGLIIFEMRKFLCNLFISELHIKLYFPQSPPSSAATAPVYSPSLTNQSCPRVHFAGPDPTRPASFPTRPDPGAR
jgi:hypothetical protein